MNSTKRLAAGTAALIFLLASCSGSNGSEGPEGTPSAPDGDVQVVKFYSDKANWEPQYQTMSARSTEGIGVGLEVFGYPDPDSYTAFIKQAMATSEKPTLFTWHTGEKLAELARAGYVTATDDIWDAAIAAGDVTESLRDQFTVDGTTYCVPLNNLYSVFYYNVEIFDELGVAPPTSWAELIDVADALVARGQTPFFDTDKTFTFTWFQTLVGGTDPDLYLRLSTGEASYTDPGVVAAMETWKDMIDKGYFNDPATADTESAALAAGSVAMLNWGSFIGPSLQELGLEPGTGYDVFTIPAVDPGLDQTPIYVEASPLCVAAGASDEEAGTAFLEYWMTGDAQSTWAESMSSISFNPKAEVGDPSLQVVSDSMGSGEYLVLQRYYEATPPPVLTVALDGFSEFVTAPGDPLPILERIQTAADEYWASQG